MIDTHDSRPVLRTARSAGTSPGAWALVLAIATALLSVRIPSFLAVAEAAVAEQASVLGDRDLASMAVAVGAISAVVLHALLLGLGALLATLLERALGPGALSLRARGPDAQGGRLRIGVGGLTFAVIVLGLQLAAVVLGVAAVERSWPVWILAAGVAVLAPWAFPGARSSASAYARALGASAGTAVLLCAG